MGFLNSLFNSSEVNIVLAALDSVTELNKKFFKNSISAEYIIIEIKKEAQAEIKGTSEYITQVIKQNEMTPHEAVLNIILSITKNKLMSGRYHIYRGTLKDSGKILADIHIFSLRQMVLRNLITQELSDELTDSLYDTVEMVG